MRGMFIGIGAALLSATGASAAVLYGVGNFAPFGNQSLYSIDPSTGAAALIGTTGLSQIADIAYDGTTDRLFALTRSNALYTLNRSTGAATLVASTPGNVPEGALALRPSDGALFVSASDTLATVNLSTAALSNIGLIPPNVGITDVSGLAFGAGGQLFAYSKNGTLEDALISVDPSTGLGTLIGMTGLTSASAVGGLAFDASTGNMFLSDGTGLFTVNIATGTATSIGSHGVAGMSGIAFIPTPGATALFGLGLLIARRRR